MLSKERSAHRYWRRRHDAGALQGCGVGDGAVASGFEKPCLGSALEDACFDVADPGDRGC